MTRKYFEVGIGQPWLCSTEIEHSDGSEVRLRGHHLRKTEHIYFRMQVGRRVIVLSKEGISTAVKPYRRFKLLLGFEGR